jgi:hypothetical protein
LVDQFIVDPVVDSEDPLQGLPGQGGGIGTLHAGPTVLSETPFVSEKILNEWVRFRKPGIFHVHVVSRRVERAGAHGSHMEVASNVLTLEIRPAPAEWVKQQIESAVKVLDAPLEANSGTAGKEIAALPPRAHMFMAPLDGGAARKRLLAGRTLRFRDSPEAAIQLLLHLPPGISLDSYSLHLGVLGSHYRAQLLQLMEKRLVAPDQPVWPMFLDTLVRLRQLITGEEKREEYLARLAESMPNKQPQARAISLNALLGRPGRIREDYVRPDAKAALIGDFLLLPAVAQRDFLNDWERWRVIEGPAMVPVLRKVYDAASDPELASIALIWLHKLAKGEAREVILAQIRNPTKHLSNSALTLLDEPTLPELNDTLAAQLEGSSPNEWLILRYATGDIAKRVKKYYLQHQNDSRCDSPLVFYFLKYDPAFGESELRRNMSTTGGRPNCYNMQSRFRDLGRYAWSEALERLMIEYLSNPNMGVKTGAGWALGEYGSSAAERPLWNALADFHSQWKGKGQQLSNSTSLGASGLEYALVKALLGPNRAWKIREEDLDRMQELCSTSFCRDEILRWCVSAQSDDGPAVNYPRNCLRWLSRR